MESAELKENGKRVRHCFPRQEVYHRWIHDDTYVYSNKRYIVSGKYDWLFAFCLNKNADRNNITYSWNSRYYTNIFFHRGSNVFKKKDRMDNSIDFITYSIFYYRQNNAVYE